MNRTLASVLLLITILAIGGGLAVWKYTSIREAAVSSANQPEPMESVTVAIAKERAHRPAATAIGTVLSLSRLSNQLTLYKVLGGGWSRRDEALAMSSER